MDMSFNGFMALPEVRAAFTRLNLGGTAPTTPLFVYHSVNDEMVPIADTDRTVAQYCSAGASVTYTRDQASEHGLLAMTGAPSALNWLTEQLAGNPAHPQCTTRTVPTSLTTTPSLRASTRGILDDLRSTAAAHGGPVG
jgi:hypothetical protein